MNADQKETSGARTEKAFIETDGQTDYRDSPPQPFLRKVFFRQFESSAKKRKENRNWQKKTRVWQIPANKKLSTL